IAKWDGSNWSDVGANLAGSSTFAVNCFASSAQALYVGGSFTNSAGLLVNRIVRWDGTNWTGLGSGLSSTVNSVLAWGSDLYVGGGFQTAGGKPSYFIARWNETRNFDLIPSISLSSLPGPPGGPFNCSVVAVTFSNYVIEASTGLSGWVPLRTNSA